MRERFQIDEVTDMRTAKRCSWLGVVALLAAGCGGDDESADTAIEPLDPEVRHYGGTYSDWAGELWRWVGQGVPDDECGEPVGDMTGELCAAGQDPDSEVFFLVGTWGGMFERTGCVVPRDKALFIPLILSSYDNGCHPEEDWQSPESLEGLARDDLMRMPTSELVLKLDGRPIEGLERLKVEVAPYEYTLPEPVNLCDCVVGEPGFTGTYAGFISGYAALLPPLPPGEHVLEFGGMVGDNEFVTRVIYDPITVE